MLYNVLSICLMHCRYLEIMTANDIHDKPWQCIVSNRVTAFLRTLKKFFGFFFLFFFLKCFIGLELLYHVVLVSSVQSESAVCIHASPLFLFLSHLGHPKALSRVPCAMQSVPMSHLF